MLKDLIDYYDVDIFSCMDYFTMRICRQVCKDWQLELEKYKVFVMVENEKVCYLEDVRMVGIPIQNMIPLSSLMLDYNVMNNRICMSLILQNIQTFEEIGRIIGSMSAILSRRLWIKFPDTDLKLQLKHINYLLNGDDDESKLMLFLLKNTKRSTGSVNYYSVRDRFPYLSINIPQALKKILVTSGKKSTFTLHNIKMI